MTPPPPLWIAPASGVAVVIALLLVASGVPEPLIYLLLALGVVAGAVAYRGWDKRHR